MRAFRSHVARRHDTEDIHLWDSGTRNTHMQLTIYANIGHHQYVITFSLIPFRLAYRLREANSIGTAWLILWPAYILIRMRYKLLQLGQLKLPSTHHRVLIACFSTSILLLIVNISHAVFFFSIDELALRITGHLEVRSSSLSFGELALLIATRRSLFLSSSAISWSSSRTFTAYLVTPRIPLQPPILLGLVLVA